VGRVGERTVITKEGVVIPSGPAMPPLIQAWINEKWNVLDPDGEKMLASFKTNTAFSEFSHARAVFKDHLRGTWATLSAWGQDPTIARAGLFHTGFSGDLFQFAFFDATSEVHRAELRKIIGEEAERLVYLFGTIDRGSLANLSSVIDPSILGQPMALPDSGLINVGQRIHGSMGISTKDAARILVVTLADYMDQAVEINGWRDHHQVDAPLALYPGDGKPATFLYWVSSMFCAIRPHLDIVPSLFDRCTSVISYEAERDARDAYWSVVLGEAAGTMSELEQEALLRSAVQANRFVGEPHILLAQLAFRRGLYEDSVKEASIGLEKLYTLATAWDKRLNYDAWVAFSRLLILRAGRKSAGLYSMPTMDDSEGGGVNLRGNLPLVSLRELGNELA